MNLTVQQVAEVHRKLPGKTAEEEERERAPWWMIAVVDMKISINGGGKLEIKHHFKATKVLPGKTDPPVNTQTRYST